MTKVNIKPLHDRVLVKPIESETVSKGGIIIPDAAKEKPLEGTVVAIGSKVDSVKVGDIILYGKFAGNELEHEGVNYLMFRESDLIAKKD